MNLGGRETSVGPHYSTCDWLSMLAASTLSAMFHVGQMSQRYTEDRAEAIRCMRNAVDLNVNEGPS